MAGPLNARLCTRLAATTLCALHYIACSLSIWATQSMGYVKKVSLPMKGKLRSSERVTGKGSICSARAEETTYTSAPAADCVLTVLFTNERDPCTGSLSSPGDSPAAPCIGGIHPTHVYIPPFQYPTVTLYAVTPSQRSQIPTRRIAFGPPRLWL